MRIAEKQDRTFLLKASVSIVDDAFAGRKANLIKILTTVNARSVTVVFYLKYLEAFQLKFVVELRNHAFCLHAAKIRNSNLLNLFFYSKNSVLNPT